jgi:deoxyribonuclease V
MIIPQTPHSWTLSEEQAFAIQTELSKKIILGDRFNQDVNLVAGVDVAYSKCSNQLFAAVVIIEANTLSVVETRTAEDRATFPYVPGLFSFRELPVVLNAMAQIQRIPDLIVCDAQGAAHPRRFGLASHLGVLLDMPTIGCAKTRLFGESKFVPTKRGEYASLLDQEEVVGIALCTQNGVKPLYVSVGHKISLDSARQWILRLSPRYRLPETTRKANEIANNLRHLAS